MAQDEFFFLHFIYSPAWIFQWNNILIVLLLKYDFLWYHCYEKQMRKRRARIMHGIKDGMTAEK